MESNSQKNSFLKWADALSKCCVRQKKKDFEEMLRNLCLAYDEKKGEYPESKFEGRALFNFYLELNGIAPMNANDPLYQAYMDDLKLRQIEKIEAIREDDENYL